MKYIDGIKTIKYISFAEAIRKSGGRIGILDCGMAIYMISDKPKIVKHIPVWEELVNAPDDVYECELEDIDFKDVDGYNTPFYIVNKVTLKGKN